MALPKLPISLTNTDLKVASDTQFYPGLGTVSQGSWGSEGGAEWVWTRWAKRCFNTKMNEGKYNRTIFTILGSSNMGVILFFVEYFLKFQKRKKIKSALKMSWTRWHQLFRRE